MESSQFDALTRAIANISTARRGLVGGALVGGLATLLAWLGVEDAEAKKNKKRRKRRKKKKRKKGKNQCGADQKTCNGACIPIDNCCVDADCGSDAFCQDGECLCPAGTKFCQEENGCIDENECCGACPPPFTCCTNLGECVDLKNDPEHCGQCTNNVCMGGDICANGNCAQACSSDANCNTEAGCFCRERIGTDGAICATFGLIACDFVPTCDSDADCAANRVCVDAPCPGAAGFCLTACT